MDSETVKEVLAEDDKLGYLDFPTMSSSIYTVHPEYSVFDAYLAEGKVYPAFTKFEQEEGLPHYKGMIAIEKKGITEDTKERYFWTELDREVNQELLETLF